MKKTILLLTLITTINYASNPFSQIRPNLNVKKLDVSQKYFYAKRAAERGNARAQFDLGLMYANGNGVEKNEALALMWFNRASQNNFAKALNLQKVAVTNETVQNNFHKTLTVPRVSAINETSQKFKFAYAAAKRGDARAQFDLGMMYQKGDGVSKNEQLAFNYFHKAARNNSVEAKFQMGLNFAKGRGVRKQAQLAKYWFKLAAKAGHPQAMAHLASLENKNRIYGQTRRVAFLSNVSAIRTF